MWDVCPTALRVGPGLATTAPSCLTSVILRDATQICPGNAVDRLLAGAGHRLYAAPTRRDDAASAAEAIRQYLRVKDTDRALRALLRLNDNLTAEHGLVRGILGLTEPEPTGDRVWDAAIAALVAWRLNQENIPLPGWVNNPDRALAEPVVLRVDPADPAPERDDVPNEFAERGVLAWADTFASV